jgi:hypothetical protein
VREGCAEIHERSSTGCDQVTALGWIEQSTDVQITEESGALKDEGVSQKVAPTSPA